MPSFCRCSKHACAPGPGGNVILEEGGELLGAGRQLGPTATDHVKIEAHDGIDQLARDDLSIAAGRYSEGGNDGNPFLCFDKGNLRVEQIDDGTDRRQLDLPDNDN
jgi:hypothetical protein